MNADLGVLFRNYFLISLIILFSFYLIKDKRDMILISYVVLLVEFLNKLLFAPLLALPNAGMFWYAVWMSTSLLAVYLLLLIQRKIKSRHGLVITLSYFYGFSIFLYFFRHIERHYSDLVVLKELYPSLMLGLNLAIIISLLPINHSIFKGLINKRMDFLER